MEAALPDAVRRARESGAQSIAVMAWSNSTVAAIRRYLCRHGLEPAQLGIWHAFDRLVDLPDRLREAAPAEIAEMVLDTIGELTPGLDATDLERAKARLEAGGVRALAGGGIVATLVAAASLAFDRGRAGYFPGVVAGIDALSERGVHAPALEEVRLYRRASMTTDFDEQLEAFGSGLITASQRPSRTDRGVLTMTVHQSKGREFDAVILFDASAESFRWNAEESIRLFYVAITRARRHWEIIAKRGNVSPLVEALGTA